jgi:hypothetical protein
MLVLALLSLPVTVPVHADAPAVPRRSTPGQPDIQSTRRTGRLPARMTVTPAGAATVPTHVIVTIPREALNGVLSGPRSGAQVLPLEQPGDDAPSDRVRHIGAGVLLALAVLSLPLLVGKRRGGIAAAVIVATVAGAALVRADIAAPRHGPVPQTVEVVIVPGSGPIQVQLTYPPR